MSSMHPLDSSAWVCNNFFCCFAPCHLAPFPYGATNPVNSTPACHQLCNRMFNVLSVDLIFHLNFALGERLAAAALAVAQHVNVAIGDIDLIGSHG